MPVYEYECSHCNHVFERKQGFDDEPIAECPVCAARARRVFRSVPVIYKGNGFYSTDNRGVSNGKPEKKLPKTKEPAGGESTPAKSN